MQNEIGIPIFFNIAWAERRMQTLKAGLISYYDIRVNLCRYYESLFYEILCVLFVKDKKPKRNLQINNFYTIVVD